MKIFYKCILLALWMLAIFLFSNEGSELSSGRSTAIVSFFTEAWSLTLPQDVLTFITRKSAHIIAYFILGILIYNVMKEFSLSVRLRVTVSILFALAYAITDEVHQLFIPGRSAELRDVFIDTMASGLGVWAWYILNRRHYSRKNIKTSV